MPIKLSWILPQSECFHSKLKNKINNLNSLLGAAYLQTCTDDV